MAQIITTEGSPVTRDEVDSLPVQQLRDAIIDAIGKQNAKANTVARKGRMQYAIRALSELGVELGLFAFESKAAKVDEPKELLTDKQKAERIVARNATKGWQTSDEVKAVAEGRAETFAAAKELIASEKAASDKVVPMRAAKKSTSSKRSKSSVSKLTTTRAE